ncbi:hypothetical protein FQR65_LT01940 [Abscondita terminalis]|nr:hypothetical protein FQR65_LT01940 [Abscondita terminalis]
MISLQYVLFGAGSFSALRSGLNFGWPSYALPQLLSNNSAVSLTNDEGSWIASMFVFEMIFGSLLATITVNAFGRKTMLLVASVPLCGNWLLIAYAKTSWSLYLARFIAGISDGLFFSSFPMFLAEVCNSKIRGFLITGVVAVMFIGVFLANLFGAFLSMSNVVFICAVLAIVPVCLYLIIPESPQFYIIKRNANRAKISLKKFNKNDNADVMLNLLNDTFTNQQNNKISWWQLFADKYNVKTLVLAVMLKFIHQFSGIVGITSYMETIFMKVKIDIDPIVFISVYFLLQLLISILTAFLIDRVGRRPLLLISMSSVTVGLFSVTIYFVLDSTQQENAPNYSWLAILGLFIYIIGYTLGLDNVPLVICSEIFTLNFKSYAIGITNAIFGLTGTAIPKIFQYTSDQYGAYVPFLIFAICSFCGLVFIYFFVPETKRKTLEEIQFWLKSKKSMIVRPD